MEHSVTWREQRWRAGTRPSVQAERPCLNPVQTRAGTRPRVQAKTNSGLVPRMHSWASRKAVSVSCADKGRLQPTSGGNQHGESYSVGTSLA